MRVPTPSLEPGQDALGIGLVVRRTDVVWFGGKQLHPVAQVFAMNESVEVAFDRGLIGRRRGGRPESHAGANQGRGGERQYSAH